LKIGQAFNPVFNPRKQLKKVKSMEAFRPSFRRQLASITGFFARLVAMLRPKAQQVRTQRMCPFCGLITPLAGRLCLECGKPLRAVQAERKAAHQE
jgi:hypothetical protein